MYKESVNLLLAAAIVGLATTACDTTVQAIENTPVTTGQEVLPKVTSSPNFSAENTRPTPANPLAKREISREEIPVDTRTKIEDVIKAKVSSVEAISVIDPENPEKGELAMYFIQAETDYGIKHVMFESEGQYIIRPYACYLNKNSDGRWSIDYETLEGSTSVTVMGIFLEEGSLSLGEVSEIERQLEVQEALDEGRVTMATFFNPLSGQRAILRYEPEQSKQNILTLVADTYDAFVVHAEALPSPTATKPEPTKTSSPTRTFSPTREAPTVAPTKEEEKYVIWEVVDAYESDNLNSKIGTLHPEVRFKELENDGKWLKIETINPEGGSGWTGYIKISQYAYSQEGTGPAQRPTSEPAKPVEPVRPIEPERSFPEKVVLANGQLEIYNDGINRYGLVVGTTYKGENVYEKYCDYINEMFQKYNRNGMILEIHFSTFPGVSNITNSSEFYQKRWEINGNRVLYFLSLNENYNPNVSWQVDRILFEANVTGLIGFLQGRYHGEVMTSLPPEDLQKLDAPVKLWILP